MQSQSFAGLGLSKAIITAVAKQGYQTPTEIQLSAIPPMREGKDVVATAQTGTGKTAAFLLPTLDRLIQGSITGNRNDGPLVLILAPTRELASQIADSTAAYSTGSGISHAVVYGGVPKPKQISALRRRPHILIATPGRLMDLVGERYVNLSAVSCLILDEGDRMLDMGFIPEVRRIAKMIGPDRQTALFSATMPTPIEELARELLLRPHRVSSGQGELSVARITQEVMHLPQAEKVSTLIGLIRDRGMYKVLVFTKTKHKASRVAKQLTKEGIKADAIHGDKSQNARQRALDSFQRGRIQVLVATDVASRGIDVDDITHVINFEIPHEPESYVHRIGRTARAGADGVAISMCDPSELAMLRAIERLQDRTLTVNRDHDFHLEPAPERKPQRFQGSRNRSRGPAGRRGGPDRGGQNGQRSAGNKKRRVA